MRFIASSPQVSANSLATSLQGKLEIVELILSTTKPNSDVQDSICILNLRFLFVYFLFFFFFYLALENVMEDSSLNRNDVQGNWRLAGWGWGDVGLDKQRL